jgi:uncharacterized protein with HEPN domain
MSSTYRSDQLYINDIIESIYAIESYLKDVDYETFIENRMLYAATIRELEIIGEAVGKISKVIKEKHSSIDYRTIKDFRNVLAHEYFGVDMEIVWMIATQKIPTLKQDILMIEI